MKVALTDMCGQVLAFECEDTPVYYSPGGGAEQNPAEWWDALVKCSNRLVDTNLVPVEDIVAISCSSQWSGTVPVDSDGHHVMNAIIWMDSRGAPYIRKLLRGIINIDGCYSITNALRWIRKTAGIPAKAGKDPIAHILFIKNENLKNITAHTNFWNQRIT
jgi:xylulokinase